MDKIFTKHELEILDDVMPESIKKKIEEADEAGKEDAMVRYKMSSTISSPCTRGLLKSIT